MFFLSWVTEPEKGRCLPQESAGWLILEVRTVLLLFIYAERGIVISYTCTLLQIDHEHLSNKTFYAISVKSFFKCPGISSFFTFPFMKLQICHISTSLKPLVAPKSNLHMGTGSRWGLCSVYIPRLVGWPVCWHCIMSAGVAWTDVLSGVNGDHPRWPQWL